MWLSDIVNTLGCVIPRRLIIRATHGGVKWKHGSEIHRLNAGVHWYWPLYSECLVMPIARQTLDMPFQTLTTRDGVQVSVSCAVIYRISDIVRAYGRLNYDVDEAVCDVARAAVVSVVTGMNYADLIADSQSVEAKLTRAAKRRLQKYGVCVESIICTDLTKCRTYRLIGQVGE